jgi:hypothetical protein
VEADPFVELLALPGVFDAVEGARAGIDGLLREPALRRRPPEVTVEALRRGAWASARLAGADVALTDFRLPLPGSLDDQSRLLAESSLRLSTGLPAMAATWRRAPLQALARLHSVAAAEAVAPDELGRPTADPAVAARLAALARLVTVPTDASAVIVAAVVHGEVCSLAPFAWGNGLVARAAQRVVLIDRGLDPAAVSIPEQGILDAGEDTYRTALAAYASGEPDGTASWLCFVAESVARGAVAGRLALAER